jgi:hypothetical protein
MLQRALLQDSLPSRTLLQRTQSALLPSGLLRSPQVLRSGLCQRALLQSALRQRALLQSPLLQRTQSSLLPPEGLCTGLLRSPQGLRPGWLQLSLLESRLGSFLDSNPKHSHLKTTSGPAILSRTA